MGINDIFWFQPGSRNLLYNPLSALSQSVHHLQRTQWRMLRSWEIMYHDTKKSLKFIHRMKGTECLKKWMKPSLLLIPHPSLTYIPPAYPQSHFTVIWKRTVSLLWYARGFGALFVTAIRLTYRLTHNIPYQKQVFGSWFSKWNILCLVNGNGSEHPLEEILS